MLTKELLRYRIQGTAIRPRFVPVDDEDLLDFAAMLIDVFQSQMGRRRLELSEAVGDVVSGARIGGLVARGLEKLLMDRCEFNSRPEPALVQFRSDLFTQGAKLLRSGKIESPERYRADLGLAMGEEVDALEVRLYADLPEQQQLLRFKGVSAAELLYRYNAAQVQGLLMRANSLSIRLNHATPALLRQMFKYIRFRQLLAEVSMPGEGVTVIEIDGPLSLFHQARKYGLQLALFFPALILQDEWELSASIMTGKSRRYELSLNPSKHLRPYGHQFLAYVPEEVERLQSAFAEKQASWTIAPADDFVALEGESYCFPDFSLTHRSGRRIGLELFHRWHASPLRERLEQLGTAADAPLLLGADRALMRDESLARAIEESTYFGEYGCLYRDMPTPGRILPLLARVLQLWGIAEDGDEAGGSGGSGEEV